MVVQGAYMYHIFIFSPMKIKSCLQIYHLQYYLWWCILNEVSVIFHKPDYFEQLQNCNMLLWNLTTKKTDVNNILITDNLLKEWPFISGFLFSALSCFKTSTRPISMPKLFATNPRPILFQFDNWMNCSAFFYMSKALLYELKHMT